MEFFLDPQNIGNILETVGTLFIAYAALRVHHIVLAEHNIDKKVLKIMKFEQVIGILGVIFIIVGYFVMVLF